MLSTTSSLREQVDAAELALRYIARAPSQPRQRPQRIAQQALQKMTLLAHDMRPSA